MMQHGHPEHTDSEHGETVDGHTKVPGPSRTSFVEDASFGTLMSWLDPCAELRMQHRHSQHGDSQLGDTVDGHTKVPVLSSTYFIDDASFGTLMWWHEAGCGCSTATPSTATPSTGTPSTATPRYRCRVVHLLWKMRAAAR